MICVEFANRHPLNVDPARLLEAVRRVLAEEQIAAADISLAVVSDQEIQQINRQFLGHDEPTDVISFLLENSNGKFIGEVVASLDTAARSAAAYGWDCESELLLYMIHGALHLAGYDDSTPQQRERMREQERHHLGGFGLTPRYESDDDHGE